MVQITKESDLDILEDDTRFHPLVTQYITQYLHLLFKEYQCSNLTKVGAIFILENQQDGKLHTYMGLSQPIEKSVAEFTEILVLKNHMEQISLLHICFVLSDDSAISVFVKAGTLNQETESVFLEDSWKRTVWMDV